MGAIHGKASRCPAHLKKTTNQKRFFSIVFKQPKPSFKKRYKKTKGSDQLEPGSNQVRIFSFAAFPNVFVFVLLGNRFRLGDLGGVEPLRKLFRQKLRCAQARV